MAKILIVDDSPINILLLKEMLGREHTILTAERGSVAIAIAEKEKPELMLLDILMPEMDGFEVLEKMRKKYTHLEMSIIMVTAKVEKEDVERAISLGANDYIKKPIDLIELETKVTFHNKFIIEQRKAKRYEQFADIHESLILAQRIQQSLLIDKNSFHRILQNSFVIFLPKDYLSGDFYYVHQNGAKKIIIVFDCTGHGVPAALIGTIVYMTLHRLLVIELVTDIACIANTVKSQLFEILSKSSDTFILHTGIDGIFCSIDIVHNMLDYCCIKRPVILVRNNHEITKNLDIEPTLHKNGTQLFTLLNNKFLSEFKNSESPLTSSSLKLELNDVIYLATDGYSDQFGGKDNKRFTKSAFNNLLIEIHPEAMENKKQILYRNFLTWKADNIQTDDVLILGIKY